MLPYLGHTIRSKIAIHKQIDKSSLLSIESLPVHNLCYSISKLKVAEAKTEPPASNKTDFMYYNLMKNHVFSS